MQKNLFEKKDIATQDNAKNKKLRRNSILKEGLNGYTIVSVRMRNAEFLEFSDQVQRANLNNNLALRIAARRIAGFIEIEESSRESLRKLSRHLGEIARDMSKVKFKAEKDNLVDSQLLEKVRTSLSKEFIETQRLLRALMSVTNRRRDGLARLEEADTG